MILIIYSNTYIYIFVRFAWSDIWTFFRAEVPDICLPMVAPGKVCFIHEVCDKNREPLRTNHRGCCAMLWIVRDSFGEILVLCCAFRPWMRWFFYKTEMQFWEVKRSFMNRGQTLFLCSYLRICATWWISGIDFRQELGSMKFEGLAPSWMRLIKEPRQLCVSCTGNSGRDTSIPSVLQCVCALVIFSA